MSPRAVLTDGAVHAAVRPAAAPILDKHAAVTVTSARRLASVAQHAVEPPFASPGSFDAVARLLIEMMAPTFTDVLAFDAM